LIRPENISAFDNDSNVIFECTTTGFPIPTLSWYHNGNLLANYSRTVIQDKIVVNGGVIFLASTLEICSTHASDSGTYSCIAENRLGTDSFDFEVDIKVGGGLYLL